MADRDRSDDLQDLLDRALADPAALGSADDELAGLARVALALRALPRQDFRDRLRTDLERMATMTAPTYVPEGLATVTPYLVVRDAPAAIRFYTDVFGAVEHSRHADDDGRILHAKLQIGTAMVELGQHDLVDAVSPDHHAPIGMHLYVPDVDSVVAAAASAGASTGPVEDQPYGDRECTVKDPFGITWYVATHMGG